MQCVCTFTESRMEQLNSQLMGSVTTISEVSIITVMHIHSQSNNKGIHACMVLFGMRDKTNTSLSYISRVSNNSVHDARSQSNNIGIHACIVLFGLGFCSTF